MKTAIIAIILLCTPMTALAQSGADELKNAQQDVQDAQTRINDLAAKIHDNESDIRGVTGRMDLSADHLFQAMAGWDDQLDALEIQVGAADARMKAIESAVKDVADQAGAAADKDPVVSDLERVVAGRKESLAMLEQNYKAALVAQVDVNTAETALAEAQAQVELQREHAIAANGGDTIAALKKELIDLKIDQQERMTQQEIIKRLRAAMDSVHNNVSQLEEEQAEMQVLRGRLDRAEQRAADLGRTYAAPK